MVVDAAVVVAVVFLEELSARRLDTLLPAAIDPLSPSSSVIRVARRLVLHGTHFHTNLYVHTHNTQREDGPTTGGAGPGGRGVRHGLCAQAPFHRRAATAR